MFFVRRPAMPWRASSRYGVAIGVFQFGLLFLGMQARHAGRTVVAGDPGAGVLHDRSRGDAASATACRARTSSAARSPRLGVAVLAIYKFAGGATGTLIGFVLVIVGGVRVGRRQHHREEGSGEHDADMFGAGRLVEPRAAAAVGRGCRSRSKADRRCCHAVVAARAHTGAASVPGVRRDAVRLRLVGARCCTATRRRSSRRSRC